MSQKLKKKIKPISLNEGWESHVKCGRNKFDSSPPSLKDFEDFIKVLERNSSIRKPL